MQMNFYVSFIKFSTTKVNTLRSRQDGHLFADDILKFIFLNENHCILIHISLKFIPEGEIITN